MAGDQQEEPQQNEPANDSQPDRSDDPWNAPKLDDEYSFDVFKGSLQNRNTEGKKSS